MHINDPDNYPTKSQASANCQAECALCNEDITTEPSGHLFILFNVIFFETAACAQKQKRQQCRTGRR